MEVEKTAIEEELRLLGVKEKEEKDQEAKDQEETKTNYEPSKELIHYLDFFHGLFFEKYLGYEIEPSIRGELNMNASKIIMKYTPQITEMQKYTPEIAYISLLAFCVMQNEDKKKQQQPIIKDV